MPMQFRGSITVQQLGWGVLLTVMSCSTPGDRDSAKGGSTAAPAKDASSQTTANAESAVRAFVQDFYAWYAPLATKGTHGPVWYTVLDQRPGVLSDTLLRALRYDREAQAKAVGEIVGLDFDPFLAAQDPCERYVVGDSVQAGRTYRVSLFGVCGTTRHPKADIVAEVVRRDTSWVFVDFHYPGGDGGHLLGILNSTSSTKPSK